MASPGLMFIFILCILGISTGGTRLTNVVEVACKRNPTLAMCEKHKQEDVFEAIVAEVNNERLKKVVEEKPAEEEQYCQKYKATFYRFCDGNEEPPDNIKKQIISFCQTYDTICVLKIKRDDFAPRAVEQKPPEQPKALVLKTDGSVVNCASPQCRSNTACWKTCRCARIDLLAREFCHGAKNKGKVEFKAVCDFWKFECTPLARGSPVPKSARSDEPHAQDSLFRDKNRKILQDRINVLFNARRTHDSPLLEKILSDDKNKPKAFQAKNYPLLPSDSSYGAGNFDSLTDTGGVLHRTRSRSPFTKPGLWEANPDNPHNRDHANKWYYRPQSVTADWLSGQITWGGHWAVPGVGVGGTDGFSAVHFPTVGTFLNIADDYD
ncbi:hypothetical protein L596_005268 [Steinernema carpocapsae]|uniref:Thyroglobulin type-1 domain-containing protein n=1 Tax=Steinernema carpocapsae TaxID=34508 RepID=A0A4V6YSY6_STECR|nr:hypothetical protein L596_005268 [Steinernema carpocapsae]